jgi:peroxiredoxin
MSLEEELAAQRARAFQKRSPEERVVRAGAIADTARSGLAEGALSVGDRLPRVVLPDLSGVLVDVNHLLESGPVAIAFYRGSWCPYCNLELRALQQKVGAIKGLGGSLVAISPELPPRTESMAAASTLTFPLLLDRDNRVARSFRLVHEIDPRVVRYQLGNGNDVAAFNGAKVAEVPLPATYVVDRSGVIRYAFVEADYTRRAEPDAILEALRQCVASSPVTLKS